VKVGAFLLVLSATVLTGSAAPGECPRCNTKTGRWCSECSPGEVCEGCRDRIWPRNPENKDFFRTPVDQEYRWEYGTKVSELGETLRSKLILIETQHFRLIGDVPHSQMHEVALLAERYYNRIRLSFRVGPTTKLFTGRCQLFCFQKYKTFRKFADSVEKAKVVGCSGGFTMVRGFEPKIALFTQGMTGDQFKRTLVHEMVHVILGLYAKGRRLKDWLQEGTAQYFEFLYKTSGSRATDWGKKIQEYLEEGELTSAAELMDMEIAPIDHQGYVESWSLVDFMIRKGGDKFGRFITLIKDGTSQTEALKKSFGVTPAELSEKWKDYLKRR
jgi:hypothetical protein